MHWFVQKGSTLPAFLTSSMSVSIALAIKQLPAKTPNTSALLTFVIVAQFDRRAAESSHAQTTAWKENTTWASLVASAQSPDHSKRRLR
jgi:hypothetical protein